MGLGPRPGERPVLPQPGFSWPCMEIRMDDGRGKEKSGRWASEWAQDKIFRVTRSTSMATPLSGSLPARGEREGKRGRENKTKFGFDSRRRRGFRRR